MRTAAGGRVGVETMHGVIRPHVRVTPVVAVAGGDFDLSAFPDP